MWISLKLQLSKVSDISWGQNKTQEIKMKYEGVGGNGELESLLGDPELKKELERVAKELLAKKVEKTKKLGKQVVSFKRLTKSLLGEPGFLNSLEADVKSDLAADLTAILAILQKPTD
jgi:hypothetical protein